MILNYSNTVVTTLIEPSVLSSDRSDHLRFHCTRLTLTAFIPMRYSTVFHGGDGDTTDYSTH